MNNVQEPFIGIWISKKELAVLPTYGPAWEALKAAADTDPGNPDISNQDQNNDIYVLAKALVYARTGDLKYREEVIDNLMKAINTEIGGRTLALGRNLPGYVISADLVNLPADPKVDAIFRSWLRSLLTENLEGDLCGALMKIAQTIGEHMLGQQEQQLHYIWVTKPNLNAQRLSSTGI